MRQAENATNLKMIDSVSPACDWAGGCVGGILIEPRSLQLVVWLRMTSPERDGGACTVLWCGGHLCLGQLLRGLRRRKLTDMLCRRFPYPSVSEIVGLSSQTKFSEEQIKVWFSAQRLKHGVSWTPEEVGASRHHIHKHTTSSGLIPENTQITTRWTSSLAVM